MDVGAQGFSGYPSTEEDELSALLNNSPFARFAVYKEYARQLKKVRRRKRGDVIATGLCVQGQMGQGILRQIV